MFAGRSTYIPLRLNNAGVISIIFAISILLLPQQALNWFHGSGAPTWFDIVKFPITNWTLQFPTNLAALSDAINIWFAPGTGIYNLAYFLLVVIFTFFYSSIVLNTRDVADNLKKTGAFIPGIRPGQPTVDYLNKILIRLTTAAAIFLGLLAVAPNILERGLNVTTIYLGSTSLLIVVGVALDTISQIEARLAMRDYRGFIKR
jgi:preprotein translocase subunit SecY